MTSWCPLLHVYMYMYIVHFDVNDISILMALVLLIALVYRVVLKKR